MIRDIRNLFEQERQDYYKTVSDVTGTMPGKVSFQDYCIYVGVN